MSGISFRSSLSAALMFRSALVISGLFLLAACGGESLSGPPATPAVVRIDGGNAQQGVAGQALPQALKVTVLDSEGRPVRNVRVSFSVAPGGGSLTPVSVQTSSSGSAETVWTLGTQTGTALATAVVSGVAPATFTATVRPGPATQIIASVREVSLGIGDTMQLRATTRDLSGNIVEQLAMSWSTLDPAVVSVNNGRITALSIGNGRVVVSATSPSGPISDTVSVSVGLAGSSICGNRQSVSLTLGGVATLSQGTNSNSVCLSDSQIGSEYALVLINTDPEYVATKSLDAVALGVSSLPTAISSISNVESIVGITESRNQSKDGGFENRLRVRERNELRHLSEAARQMSSDIRNNTGLYSQVQPPVVGSLMTLNSQPLSACSEQNNRIGRVVAVSDRAIIVADTTNPSGGYTDEEYSSIAATFDTLTYPLDVEYFGEPSDISRDGRILLFYTRTVNQLTPPNANYLIGGFFFARDLYPKQAKDGLPACAGSNEREMMYLLVADPNGIVNGNRRSKADVTRLNRTSVAHELQHLINAGRRLHVTAGAEPNEDIWLDEGLSHTAEELLYFRTARRGSKENLGIAQITSSQNAATLFSSYAVQNFARWTSYLRSPEAHSPYAMNDSAATRGATWHFLRYAASHSSLGEAAFYRKLVTGPATGFENLNAAIAPGSLSQWLRNWAISVFADDLVSTGEEIYQMPAWNFRSIMPSLTVGGQALGAYPLATRTFVANSPRRITLAGGGSSYIRFRVPSSGNALISVSLNGATVPTDIQMAVVRYR